MSPAQLQKLLSYPQGKWRVTTSERWISLCDGLRDYPAPDRSLVISSERKWELVSAFQKSIRRGDKSLALRLVSAIDAMPEERAYFWKRLCVIACEDVGPADDTLASFIVACTTVFPPKTTGSSIYDLTCYLVGRMCDLPARSRIYCSVSVIELAVLKSTLPELTAEDALIVSAILQQAEAVRVPGNPWQAWQRKNAWRAEGMLHFVGLRLSTEMTMVTEPVPPFRILCDLPSYAYDTHTRVGLEVLRRLARGVEGGGAIGEFFRQNRVKTAHRALGMALFFAEGGRIRNELICQPVAWLEQRTFAHQYGIPPDNWLNLRALVEKSLADGVIDRVREEVLRQFYGTENCNQLHEQGSLDLGHGETEGNTSN